MAATGVIAMHAVHLLIGRRIGSRALAREMESLGRANARLVAQQAADPVLVNDFVTLHEVVTRAAASEGVAYCFVVRDGRVLASSFLAGTPGDLLRLRGPGDRDPVVVKTGGRRLLDLTEPILGGEIGEVRVGLDLSILQVVGRELAVSLGLLAVAVIAAGIVAALAIGRSVARPVARILEAADRFDPGAEAPVTVRVQGSDEIAVLGDRFNRMMARLRTAHRQQEQGRQREVETERLVALGSLVAGVAHEVNNPLAGLRNCLRRLQRENLSSQKREEYLTLMEEGLDRIEDVVKQLLDFGRPHPVVVAPIRVADVAREAQRLVVPLLARRDVRCDVVDDGGAEVAWLADRHKVGQAVVNLLLNAAWVTAQSGQVRIRVARRDGFCGIAVEDDGPGIPAEIRDRILDPFFTTKPEGEGTGLGLSVTRSIADAHGGKLTFEFPERGGTTATLWLPEVGHLDRLAG